MADSGAYDLLIVGGGLAGMTAGMYAARYGLSTALIEQMMGGAQIINVERIENFPGFPGRRVGRGIGAVAARAGHELRHAVHHGRGHPGCPGW